MSKIIPLPGYVLISPIEEENVSAGGVYTPETSKDKPSKGKIIDVRTYGHDKEFDFYDDEYRSWHSEIKKDQTVIYKKWTNQEVSHKGKTYLLVHFNELLGVIE